MSKTLIEKLRRARETKVTVDGHTYTIRRPTDLEADEFDRAGGTEAEMVQKFVVDWDLKEIDIIPGGMPEPVPFHPGLWAEWVADHRELWGPLSAPIREEFKRHAGKREESEKNS